MFSNVAEFLSREAGHAVTIGVRHEGGPELFRYNKKESSTRFLARRGA